VTKDCAVPTEATPLSPEKNGGEKEKTGASTMPLELTAALKSVLDNIGIAMAIIDSGHRFFYTNQAALKMFGATENLPYAEWRRDYRFHDNQGREIPADEAPLLRIFAGEEVKPHDVHVTLPDGRGKWFHAAAQRLSVLGLTGVFVMVSDETQEVELRKALEQAQHIEAFGILAGGLVHDFNNILSVLSGNITLALRDDGIQDVTCARLHEMSAAIDKATVIVNRLMKYKRKPNTPLGVVQINDVVKAVLELVRPLLKSEVRVKVEVAPSLPVLQADSSRLEQVFLNLILNAIDAMPGGGELVVCTELAFDDAAPEGNGDEKKQFVRVTIADNGIGIPENLLSGIFEPFVTTKSAGVGAGLGLSSARSIVDEHEGHIKVESAPGTGTRFRVYLPVLRALEADGTREEVITRPQQANEKKAA